MRRRFFIDHFESNSAALIGEPADHLGRVLRAEAGQLYELSDGRQVHLARIERVALSKNGKSRIEFALVESIPSAEPRLQIELLLSLVKFDRFEWSLEKATELGATTIVPLAATRTDKPLIAAAHKRHERWQKILLESAQQSRRLHPVQLVDAITSEKAFTASAAAITLILSERATAPSLRTVLAGVSTLAESKPISISLAIGPEGGWTEQEFAAAHGAGFAEASLTRNILRTETAVIAALAAIDFALSS